MKQIDVKMINDFILYECVINFEIFFYFSIFFFLRCSINCESVLIFDRKIENFNSIIHFQYLHIFSSNNHRIDICTRVKQLYRVLWIRKACFWHNSIVLKVISRNKFCKTRFWMHFNLFTFSKSWVYCIRSEFHFFFC